MCMRFCRIKKRSPFSGFRERAFTLIEMMVSCVILMMIMVMLGLILMSSMKVWQKATIQSERARGEREGVRLDRVLSRATLGAYYEATQKGVFLSPENEKTFVPDQYQRYSELRFRSGPASLLGLSSPRGNRIVSHAVFFQAPLGIQSDQAPRRISSDLLNTVGFYVEYGDVSEGKPEHVKKNQKRFRLIQMVEPSDRLSISKFTNRAAESNKDGRYQGDQWYKIPLEKESYSYVVAENVLCLALRCHDGGKELNTYDYSSVQSGNFFHDLPPVIEVTMVILDERSAQRIQEEDLVAELGIESLFQNPTAYAFDLTKIQEGLQKKKLNFQLVTYSVEMVNSTWGRPSS